MRVLLEAFLVLVEQLGLLNGHRIRDGGETPEVPRAHCERHSEVHWQAQEPWLAASVERLELEGRL